MGVLGGVVCFGAVGLMGYGFGCFGGVGRSARSPEGLWLMGLGVWAGAGFGLSWVDVGVGLADPRDRTLKTQYDKGSGLPLL